MGIIVVHQAWRRCVKRLLAISPRTCSQYLNVLIDDMPVEFKLHKRLAKFIWKCITGNSCSQLCALLAVHGSYSHMGKSVNVICYKYDFDKNIITDDYVSLQAPDVPDAIFERCEQIKAFMYLRENTRGEYANITDIINTLCEESVWALCYF